jgi:hypothetical protein
MFRQEMGRVSKKPVSPLTVSNGIKFHHMSSSFYGHAQAVHSIEECPPARETIIFTR